MSVSMRHIKNSSHILVRLLQEIEPIGCVYLYIYFKELANVVTHAAKSKTCWIGWQARELGKSRCFRTLPYSREISLFQLSLQLIEQGPSAL